MKNKSRTLLTTLVLISSLLACNLPEGVQPTLSVNDQAATAIEATLMEGRRNGADVPITATYSQTPPPPATVTPGPTATITPTYSVPMLKVLEQTNCRTGPGQDYEVVHTYLAWKELEIVGAYPQMNYWLVKSAESPTGQCWLWGEYVEVTGSFWAVSSVTPPPTATQAPPAAPSIQEWTFSCNIGQVTVSIKWTDRAVDEGGYRVIRNEQAVAELPADSKAYAETISYASGDKFVYYIEVYNATGPVRSTSMPFTCP